ncbi:MAG: antibiotic biosynthesis monooxygenase [Helicobacteraceae bacterium]|nr:antibiotic biosynthesis monooxygenase [Helicobacteraceae bacterium]
MVYCTAEFKAKEGKEHELIKTLKALEEPTRKEEGCIQYVCVKKIESEFAGGEHGGVLMNEIWQSVEIFEKHCQMPYVVKFFEEECLDPSGLVESFNVNLFE